MKIKFTNYVKQKKENILQATVSQIYIVSLVEVKKNIILQKF